MSGGVVVRAPLFEIAISGPLLCRMRGNFESSIMPVGSTASSSHVSPNLIAFLIVQAVEFAGGDLMGARQEEKGYCQRLQRQKTARVRWRET